MIQTGPMGWTFTLSPVAQACSERTCKLDSTATEALDHGVDAKHPHILRGCKLHEEKAHTSLGKTRNYRDERGRALQRSMLVPRQVPNVGTGRSTSPRVKASDRRGLQEDTLKRYPGSPGLGGI